MKFVKKSFFTLLELLVVLLILAIGAVTTGIKIKEAYQEQRFISEVEQILGHLQMAQDLMLILDTDVYFDITKYQNGNLIYQLEVEKPLIVRKSSQIDASMISIDKELSKKWSQFIERQIVLNAIRSFDFIEMGGKEIAPSSIDDLDDLKILKKIRLHFTLGKMSKGVLTLSTASSEDYYQSKIDQNQKIILTGYPCSIRHQKEEYLVKDLDKIRESQDLYPNLKTQ